MLLMAYGDVHFRDTGSFVPFNRIGPRGISLELENKIKGCAFVADKITELKPDVVFLCGDVVQTTEYQTTQTLYGIHLGLSLIKEACDKIGIPHIIYMGNHDCLNETFGVTAIHQLQGYGQIITEEQVVYVKDTNIGVVPYCGDPGLLYMKLTHYDGDPSIPVIMAHADFHGCSYENHHISQSGLKAEWSTPIISGDIHLAQDIGSIHYPGSLVQDRFSRPDLSGVGGVLTWDSNTKTIHRHPNTYSRHYVKVRDLEQLEVLDPEHCVLQVVLPHKLDDVKSYLEGFEYMYSQDVASRGEIATVYSEFNILPPEVIFRAYVEENNPQALGEFEAVMG